MKPTTKSELQRAANMLEVQALAWCESHPADDIESERNRVLGQGRLLRAFINGRVRIKRRRKSK